MILLSFENHKHDTTCIVSQNISCMLSMDLLCHHAIVSTKLDISPRGNQTTQKKKEQQREHITDGDGDDAIASRTREDPRASVN